MKLAWAIICSMLLAVAPFASGQTAATVACGKVVNSCCSQGEPMPCCAAQSTPEQQSTPVAPAQSSAQNQIQLFLPVLVAWTLPESPAVTLSSTSVSPLTADNVPLFERNCALLL